MSKILEMLQKRNLLGRRGPKVSKINSLSLSQMVDYSTEIDEMIKTIPSLVKNPIFSYSASSGLGGSTMECNVLDCRISRINELSRFALMYSDKVFIRSFFSAYKDLTSAVNIQMVKKDFYNDLQILNTISPLLEGGYIHFFSTDVGICFSCQAKRFLDNDAGNRFDRAYRRLQKDYLSVMSVECGEEYGNYVFDISGPPPYFEHNVIHFRQDPPLQLCKRTRIMQNIRRGKIVPLSKTLTKEIGLHIDKAHDVAQNAIFGLATSASLNTTFLTENDLHISFLNSLHQAPEIREKNAIALKHLTSIVPFVEDVSLSNLIKVREREEESFITYRQALNNAIDNFSSVSKTFTEQDAKALYGDIIAPNLAVLDKRVKKAKRDLISKPARSLTGVVGAISFGILTGLIPPNVSAIAAAIGLAKFGGDFIKDSMAIGDKEEVIKNDHFYFLWKVKKKGKN